jgi:hypothetical protein
MHFKRRIKSSRSIWPRARIALSGICAAAVIVGGVAIAGVSTAGAAINGPENFPNSAIATQAALYLNQDISPKQCLEFALDMIHAAGGTQFYFGDDTSLYQGEWTSKVHAASIPSLADAQVGDIVQWPGGPMEKPVPHTLIISSLAADPMQDMVIDDNVNNDDVVRTGTFASRVIAVGRRTDYQIWRVGRADGGSPPPPQLPPPPTQVPVTATVSSTANPSSFGQTVTLTTTVVPQAADANTPTGAVTMFDGSTEIGSGNLSGGTFSVTESSWSVGVHPITATYGGDSNFFSGSSSTFNQIVNKAATITTVTSSANPSVFGQPVTLTATVTPNVGSGTPTGTAQLFSGTTSIGSGTLTNGAFSITQSSLAVGTFVITATYSGDSTFLASTSTALNQVVNKAPTQTSMAGSPTGSAGFGNAASFTATVTVPPPGGGTPTGTVAFSVDGTNVGQTPLSPSLTATIATSALSPGSHVIGASYGGDGDFLGSSTTLSYLVTCTHTITGTQYGAVVASGSSTCVLGADLVGSIIVPAGTSLAVENSTVVGGISASAPQAVQICGSNIGGSLVLSGAQGLVIIGDPGDANCAVNTFKGSMTVRNNSQGVEIIGNSVGGALTAGNNYGPGPYPGDGSSVSGNSSANGSIAAPTTVGTTSTAGPGLPAAPPTTVGTTSTTGPGLPPAAAQALANAQAAAASARAATNAPPVTASQSAPTGSPPKDVPTTSNPPLSTTPSVIDTRKRVDTAPGE